jgi:succinate dehydrogenase/fumarate reductase flavoprotein subunit
LFSLPRFELPQEQEHRSLGTDGVDDMQPNGNEPAQVYDVVIAGTGIAGVAAALAAAEAGLSVALFEKDAFVGGGTCLSYGGIWVGCNHLAKAAGISDSRNAVHEYMRFVAGGAADDKLMATYIDQSPVAIDFFSRCGVAFQLTRGLADHYYPVAPGSTADGRSIEPAPISTDELGDWGPKIRDSFVDPRILTVEEFTTWGGVVNYNNWDHERIAGRIKNRIKANGPALIAHFVKALLKRNVPIFLATPVQALEHESGCTSGVRIREGRAVRARKGVVLATGGWEGDPILAREFEGVPDACSPFPRAVNGDGWRLACAAGATTALIRNNLAIMLGFYVPPDDPTSEAEFRLAQIMECQCPHTIIVNARGERFSDESYFQDTVEALRRYDIWARDYVNSPSYLIFDRQYVDGFSFAGAVPGTVPPQWVSRGDTLDELASKLAISPEGLARTVANFNTFAHSGIDQDFHRGEKRWSLADRDAIKGGNPINRRLGTLEKPPYYGLRLYPGVFVSSGGVRTNSHGQVVDAHGTGIANLYAVGNVSAHLEYGIGYQAGYSLTSGMTFGYLAVQHMLRGG